MLRRNPIADGVDLADGDSNCAAVASATDRPRLVPISNPLQTIASACASVMATFFLGFVLPIRFSGGRQQITYQFSWISTVAENVVPASHVDAVMKYVGFNNIPFDQSVGVLSIFLNMFYPTDNTHVGEILGYYRQREWRLIAGDLLFNNRAMGRSLTQQEVQSLNDIDSQFWTRDLIVDGRKQSRSSLALAYDPVNNWNLFDLVEAVHVPQAIVDDVKQVVGDAADVRPRA